MNKKAFQVFTITLSANESRQILFQGSYFKLLSASGILDVTIEGQGTLPNLTAGRGLKDTAYSRLILTDKTGASNTVELFCATEEYVDQTFSGIVALDAATLAALESVDLNVATLAALESVDLNVATLNTLTRPLLPSANWNSLTQFVANTPLTIFAPGVNTNGAIIHMAEMNDVSNGGQQAFIAKTSAPSSVTDGEVIALSQTTSSGANDYCFTKLTAHTRIAAGLGLYAISSVGGVVGRLKAARYTLL